MLGSAKSIERCLNIVAPLTFISETILLVTALALKRTKHLSGACLPYLSQCTKQIETHFFSEPEMTFMEGAVRAKGSRSENVMILSLSLILPVQEGSRNRETSGFVCLAF